MPPTHGTGDIGNHISNALDKVSWFGISVHEKGARSGNVKLLYIGGHRPIAVRAPSLLATHLRAQRQLTPAISLDETCSLCSIKSISILPKRRSAASSPIGRTRPTV